MGTGFACSVHGVVLERRAAPGKRVLLLMPKFQHGLSMLNEFMAPRAMYESYVLCVLAGI